MMVFGRVWSGREDSAGGEMRRAAGKEKALFPTTDPLSGSTNHQQIINKLCTTVINTAKDLRLIESIRSCWSKFCGFTVSIPSSLAAHFATSCTCVPCLTDCPTQHHQSYRTATQHETLAMKISSVNTVKSWLPLQWNR